MEELERVARRVGVDVDEARLAAAWLAFDHGIELEEVGEAMAQALDAGTDLDAATNALAEAYRQPRAG